jgi:hypothetical protein
MSQDEIQKPQVSPPNMEGSLNRYAVGVNLRTEGRKSKRSVLKTLLNPRADRGPIAVQ